MSMKSVVTVARAAVLGVAAVTFWGLAPGCGPSIGAYCDKACECMGCSQKERDDCTDNLDDAKRAAEHDGCSDQFNDYLSCVNEELECKDDRIEADGCETEAEALGKCSDGTVVGKNACEKFGDAVAARYDACGVFLESGEPGDCTESLAAQSSCLLPCVDLLPCECIDSNPAQCTTDMVQPYLDCATGC